MVGEAQRAQLIAAMGGETLIRRVIEAVQPYGVQGQELDIGSLVFPDDRFTTPRVMRVTRGPGMHAADWQLWDAQPRANASPPEYIARSGEVLATIAVLEAAHALNAPRTLKFHTFRFCDEYGALTVRDAYLE
jgi:hypothetical protein